MRVEHVMPPPTAPTVRLLLTRDEARAVAFALSDAYMRHPRAERRDEWQEWAEAIRVVIGE